MDRVKRLDELETVPLVRLEGYASRASATGLRLPPVIFTVRAWNTS